jgi:hypothetical protein
MRNKLKLSQVSARTIRRTLDEHKLFGRKARKEYPFTSVHIRKRLSFGNGYMNRHNWNDVLFSDEKTFELVGGSSQQWVQRPEGQAFNSEYVTNKQPHGKKVHIWGCFSANGMGEFELFTDNLDGTLLKKILTRHLVSSANKLFGTNHWWYLQDNDPKHRYRSDVVKTFLFRNGIQCLELSPYSGDLNPIENLWSDLNRRIESHFSQTINELQNAIETEWNNTSALLLSKLVASMTKRCTAVVNNHGHKTKY